MDMTSDQRLSTIIATASEILITRVSQELRRRGHADLVAQFTIDATSGDYDHLLATCVRYINIE